MKGEVENPRLFEQGAVTRVAQAGSEPVAWRCRQKDWSGDSWVLHEKKPYPGWNYDIVEPLYATPTPALAPQDGGLRPPAGRAYVSDEQSKGEYSAEVLKLTAPRAPTTLPEPDLLPGLKLARDVADHWHQRFLTLRSEIPAHGWENERRRSGMMKRSIGAKQVLDEINDEISRREGSSK